MCAFDKNSLKILNNLWNILLITINMFINPLDFWQNFLSY